MQSKRWTIFNLRSYKNEILISSDKNNNLPLVNNILNNGNLTLPFERACIFMSETMFIICEFFQYGGLIIVFYSRSPLG
jgi:hypothetical protein